MGTIRKEYERFLGWLASQTTTTDTRRLADFVLVHFDDLLPLGTGASARSKYLVQQAQKNFDAVPAEMPAYREESATNEIPWKRLRRLEVGPFRGFVGHESFDLDKRIVLVYGPNGSGKSSLCEALEFALLGAVHEAEARRLAPQAYLTNARVGHFANPRLLASGQEGEDVPVAADADAFRFCFIEKNRIDDFARLAAKTQGERARLIATLFGVDRFDEFVRDFNETLEGRIVVEGGKRKALETARQNLKADEALVQEETAKRESLNRGGDAIANKFKPGCSFEEMVAELGTPEHPGRLLYLDRRLEEPHAEAINLKVYDLEASLKLATTTLGNLTDLDRQLELRRGEVSFKQLFLALIDLENDSPDRCPACDTPLTGPRAASRDPFQKAKVGLQQLADLADLEGRRDQAATLASAASRRLKDLLDKVLGVLSAEPTTNVALQETLRALPEDPKGSWWSGLVEGTAAFWRKIVAATGIIECHDAEILTEEREREKLREERTRLREIWNKIVAHRALQRKLDDDLAEAKARIACFDEENKAVISSIPEEDKEIARNKRIVAAYDTFLSLLRQYRDSLPGTLAAGLNGTAMGLYNGFNRGDHESDRLVALGLPLSVNDRIEVTFAGKPSEPLDALQVLSEGHIRCLGLAILLAKNIKLRCPFLLFDDAVNAIDPDHKEGIRLTLFHNPDLAEKQILVTCHGEEFIKDIENMLGADRRKQDCRSYVLLPHEGDHVIRVDANPASRNYLLSAQEKFKRREIRDAIAEGRRVAESINHAVWKLLERKDQGEVSLKIRGPKARYEQNDLANKLRRALKEDSVVVPNKEILIQGYDCLLDDRNWPIFNAAIHDSVDREDFDCDRFRRVLDALVEMDRCLS